MLIRRHLYIMHYTLSLIARFGSKFAIKHSSPKYPLSIRTASHLGTSRVLKDRLTKPVKRFACSKGQLACLVSM